MRKSNSGNYPNIKPIISKYVIYRYAEPDPPLIYNRKTHQLIKVKSYKVLDILELCNGERSIEEISKITNIESHTVYSLLKKIKDLGWLVY